MRQDISKVICERPRLQPSDEATRVSRRSWRQNPNDDMTFIGMKKIHKLRHGYNSKQLNENLNPLYRFLGSRCGKRWDDVYSEICANLNKNSAIQLHIFQHLEHMVEKDVQIINGEVCDSKGIQLYRFRDNYYVDSDGILRELSRHPKRKYNNRLRNAKTGTYQGTKNQFIRTDNELIDYCMIGGIWYEVVFNKMTKEDTRYKDILDNNKTKLLLSHWDEREFNIYFDRIPIKKCQLNSKEIKKLLKVA